MIKRLLVVMASAALISLACFTVLGLMGGFPPKGFGPQGWGPDGPPWANGDWNRRDGRDPGPEITRTLSYGGGPRLEISYPAEITVTQGPTPSFTVTGPKAVVDGLQLNDGTLEGRYGRHWNGRRYPDRLTITVVTPDTHEFHLAGAEKLTIRNYDQESLTVHAAGASEIEAQGRAKRLEAHIAGAGHLDMEQLPVDDADISIAGAADASLDARVSSEISIAGAGHVQLKCRPTHTNMHGSPFAHVDYGPDCSSLPAPAPAPATPAEPAKPDASASPAPKTKV